MAENRAAELNGGDDEDEALRIAIAMSLGQDPAADRNARDDAVVDLTGDRDDDETESGSDDDGDGNEPIVTKPLHVPSSPRKPQDQGQQQQQHQQHQQQQQHVVPSSLSGLAALGIDRKAMEQERLARLNKRKASSPPSEPVELRPQQRQKTLVNEGLGRVLQPSKSDRELPSRDVKIGGDGRVRPDQPYNNDGDGSGTAVPLVIRGEQRSRLPYPRGVVKKTWAYGHARQGDDIRIEEVLQKDKLKLAVLSSYQWDDEWLLSKVDLARTKVILVAFAATETQKEEMRSNVPRERIRFCFPPMLGVGSMHSKLQLLKYDDYLRIVVPTGNLVSYDWGETGVMENMVFLIDLPRLETAEQREAQQFTAFGDDLLYFLLAQGLNEKLVDSLRNYDFSETSRYAFVHTIAGSHSLEEKWSRTGYCGLGRAVKALGLGLEEPVEVDFVCASIGAVNDSLLSALYYACQGDSGVKEYESRTAGGRKVKDAKLGQDDDVAAIKRHFRVYFPSEETVLESKDGKDGAGTICFQARWWEAPSFPHEMLRDCKSTRKGLLMHSKVIYVSRKPNPEFMGVETGKSAVDMDMTGADFAYVGSANISESAWGRLVKDRGTGKPKLTCRNWEAGVLILATGLENSGVHSGSRVPSSLSSSLARGDSKSMLHQFAGCVPVPMAVPGQPLSLQGPKAPWFYQDS